MKRLREAIDAFRTERMGRLSPQALKLLARLANNPDAADAFERLKPRDRDAEARILLGSIEADDIARTFRQRIAKQKAVSARAKGWTEAVAALHGFVDEVAEKNEPLRIGFMGLDLWSLSIHEPPANAAELQQALDLIASSIEWRHGIAEANLAHLGVTRDMSIRQAAENAAIWVLAAQVYDATRKPPLPGKPHRKEVADLAEVILGTEVSVERVREVQRKRQQLYLEMFGNQTERYHREKAARAPPRDRCD